ncbi:hypothetical protein niasHT_013168 [Heterodera trifolii]|uniref:DUF5641 domain-containing protein n=1 Tax=Heterodera trifolii TaxID=157864 RepID=A0ABD2KU44_9BILA
MEPLMEHKVCGTTIPKCGEHLRQRPQHICVPSTRILIRGVEFEQLRVRHCSVTRGSSGPASPGYSLAIPMQPEQAHLNPQGQREKGPHPHQTDYLAGLKHRCDTRQAMTETGFRSVTAAALDTSGISPVDSERPCPPLWEVTQYRVLKILALKWHALTWLALRWLALKWPCTPLIGMGGYRNPDKMECVTTINQAGGSLPREGDIVLVEEGEDPRSIWTMGKVEKLLKGRDGLVRTARVHTKGKTLV